MAYTLPAIFSVTIQDELGVEAPFSAYALLDSTQTLASAVTALNSLIAVLDPITDGVIIRSKITLQPPLPGGLEALTAGARVEQTGLFNFSATGTPHRFGEAVPAMSNAKITTHGIDLVDGAVAAFIAFLTTVITVATWVTNHREALTALRDALVSFRKRRKQTTRVTLEIV
jgi:hypothetical protein